jgi:hypothetical protein
MGDQPHKTGAKLVGEAAKKTKNPVPAVQAVLEAEPLALFADPMTLQRAMANPGGLPPRAIPGLQRAIGNQHVQLMLARTEPVAGIAAQIQRQAIEGYVQQRAAPDDAQLEVAQRQADPDGGAELADPVTDEITRGTRRGGSQLPKGIQAKMKRNLGVANPEEIQVHTDNQADMLSKALGARAFTTGSHIFFQQGEYDPGSSKGQALLYHESVHTVQQGGVKGNAPQTKMVVNPPDDRYEQEAEAVAEQAVLTPEPTRPQFVEPSAKPKTTPHVSQKDDEESDEGYQQQAEAVVEPTMRATEKAGLQFAGGNLDILKSASQLAVPTMSHVQMAEEKKEEKEESEEEKKEKEEKAKEKEKEEKEREQEAKEKGKEKEKEAKESGKEKKDSSKTKAKDAGKQASQPKEKKPSPKIPKAAGFTPPPPKVDPSVVDNLDGDTAAEVKFDPDTFEFEEPEQQPLLPTWDQLAEGTVQLSMEEVQEEYRIRLGLAASDPAGFEDIGADGGFALEKGEPPESQKSGADLVGEAFAEGMLSGFQQGAESWLTDSALELATSKIKYGDGLINLCKLAYDPKAWVEDNVFAVGGSAKAMAGAFKDIGSEDTGWGVIAAILEAAISVIDFINSIIGLINQILTMLLWIFRALVTVGNFMIGLTPTVIVIVLVPVFPFAWTPAVFGPIVSFSSSAISFLDPLNTVIGQIGTVLGAVKFQLQPLAIMFRTIDMLWYTGDPEKMEEKQAKLQSNISGFVSSATTKTAENVKDKAVKGINRRRDQKKIKKLENELGTGQDTDLEARIAAKKEEFKEKYGESVEEFRGKSKGQRRKDVAKAMYAPVKTLGDAFAFGVRGVKTVTDEKTGKKKRKWELKGIAAGVKAVKKKGFKGALASGFKGLGKTYMKRRREVQEELRKEHEAVGEKVRKKAGESKRKIEEEFVKKGKDIDRPEAEPGIGLKVAGVLPVGTPVPIVVPERTSLQKVEGRAQKWAKRAKKVTGEPGVDPETQKHLKAKGQAEVYADHQREQAQDAHRKATEFDGKADEYKTKAGDAAKAKQDREQDVTKFNKQADDAESAAKTHRKQADGAENRRKGLNKEVDDLEKGAQNELDKAKELKGEANVAESRAKYAERKIPEKQHSLKQAEEDVKAARERLKGVERANQGVDTEEAKREIAKAKVEVTHAEDRMRKADKELKDLETEKTKANAEAGKKRKDLKETQEKAKELQGKANKKRLAAQEAEKKRDDSLNKAKLLDETVGQKRQAAKQAQQDALAADRQRIRYEKEKAAFQAKAAAERKKERNHNDEARRFEVEAKKEGYRVKPSKEDKELEDAWDKWFTEPVFGGQRHGPGTLGTNLIRDAFIKRVQDHLEYAQARKKTNQAIQNRNDGQYQDAVNKIKELEGGGLGADTWQERADDLGKVQYGGALSYFEKKTNIEKYQRLADDIRTFYGIWDPRNPPPVVGRRLKLQLNALTPGLPDNAEKANEDDITFVVKLREQVGGEYDTLSTDEITDFPLGTGTIEQDYFSPLPASERPIGLTVRPKAVEFKVNGVERTYTPKYRKVDKYYEQYLTRYEVWTGYDSTLQFTSSPVTAATIGEEYRYNIGTDRGDEGGTPSISYSGTLPPGLTWSDNQDGTATLQGTPNAAGEYEVTLQATDDAGFTATQSFTVTVRERLAFTSVPVTTVTAGEDYRYDITAQDLDPQPGDQLVITAQTQPTWLTFTDNGDGAATLEGDAANLQIGEHQVELKAERQRGGTAVSQTTQSFILTVRPVMGFTSTPITYATRGEAYSYSITTAGASGRTISAPTKPTWLALTDNGDGTATLTGTPSDTTPVGEHDVTADGQGSASNYQHRGDNGLQRCQLQLCHIYHRPRYGS